jgi:hypothetical protein
MKLILIILFEAFEKFFPDKKDLTKKDVLLKNKILLDKMIIILNTKYPYCQGAELEELFFEYRLNFVLTRQNMQLHISNELLDKILNIIEHYKIVKSETFVLKQELVQIQQNSKNTSVIEKNNLP